MHLLKQIKVSLLRLTNKDDPYFKLSPRPYAADSSPLLFQNTTTDDAHLNTNAAPGASPSGSTTQATPSWVSIMKDLLDERSQAANNVNNQASSGSSITSIQLHRDLVGWSMTVASAERELKVILDSLKADGVSLDEVLRENIGERDREVVGWLWID
jgi:hypothetical protein